MVDFYGKKCTYSETKESIVTGTVDTIGANKNHWKWTNAAGESKTDEDDLINSGANANNNWKIGRASCRERV